MSLIQHARAASESERGPVPPLAPEGIIGRTLGAGIVPRRIVVIRQRAFGDAVVTIPLLAGLREAFPESRIELVTSIENQSLFESLPLLDKVWGFPARPSKVREVTGVATLAPKLGSPDLLLDLQRSKSSLLIGALIRPKAWVAFDRFAPKPALERYLDAVRWVGLDTVEPRYQISLDKSLEERAGMLLTAHTPPSDRSFPDEQQPLVCLNPAGCWPTKNWPIEYYIGLARKIRREWNGRIVLIGTGYVREGAAAIAEAMEGDVIDLVGKTSTAEAFAIVQRLQLMVSDDSGLMHLAWVCGIPTVALFGASRRVWSRPCGVHSYSFGSEDLECGPCMSETCARGDLYCLRRIGVEQVFDRCREMMRNSK